MRMTYAQGERRCKNIIEGVDGQVLSNLVELDRDEGREDQRAIQEIFSERTLLFGSFYPVLLSVENAGSRHKIFPSIVPQYPRRS